MADPGDPVNSRLILKIPDAEIYARKVGSGPEYDNMLLHEAAKYKVGEFMEDRAISAVSEKASYFKGH